MKVAILSILLLVLGTPVCVLGQSSVLEAAKKQAVLEFPDLGVAGSELNKRFLAVVREKEQSDPNFFRNEEWPLKLVRSLAPERFVLQLRVFQRVEHGALVYARVGRTGRVTREERWTNDNPLDGTPRTNRVTRDEVLFGPEELVFVHGLGAYDGQSGDVEAYQAGEHLYRAVNGAERVIPRYALNASTAWRLLNR